MSEGIIYISGPMSGIPNYNEEAFKKAEGYLNDKGFNCVNPIDVCSSLIFWPADSEEHRWKECIKRDIIALLDCTGIFLLPGWNDSKGAKLEFKIASELGFDVMSYSSEEWRS